MSRHLHMATLLHRCLITLLLSAGIASPAWSQTSPDFTVRDIQGNTHNLYSYTAAGKYVLLDFFAYSCGPCYSASEDISGLYNYYGCNQHDLVVILMGRFDTDSALTASFASQANVTAPIVPGPAPFNGAGTYGIYGVTGIPVTRLISPSNQIIPTGPIADLPRVLDSLGIQPPATPACPTATADILAQGFNTAACTPGSSTVTIYNYGHSFIRTFTYSYALDGNPAQQGTWTGDIFTNNFFNSITLNLPMPQMSDRDLEYDFKILSVNGGPDSNPSNDHLVGTQPIKFLPEDFSHVEDFESAPLHNLHNVHREATWWSMPKWKQGPYSYGGGGSCIMLQGDSTMQTQAYNDEARFILGYEWLAPPILGDTARVVFDVACGFGTSTIMVEIGNHCDYVYPVNPMLPTQLWMTNASMNFFPSGPADWRTVAIDIPSSFISNASGELFIRWNLKVGQVNTFTPNIFIDNIRFQNLAVKRIEPQASRSLEAWPNPGSTQLSLRREPSSEGAQVQLFSALGQLAGQWDMPGERLDLDTQSLPCGVYMVRLIHPDGSGKAAESLRWVKQ